MTEWKNDPWYERNEEFYNIVYKGGVCRYCKKKIITKLDTCNCTGMIMSRERFKKLIRKQSGYLPAPQPPAPMPEPKFYNPDKFHEQETESDL